MAAGWDGARKPTVARPALTKSDRGEFLRRGRTQGEGAGQHVTAPPEGAGGQTGRVGEVFDNVSTKGGATNGATGVKARAKLSRLEEVGNGGSMVVPGRASVKLTGGTAVTAVRVTADDYVGNSADRTGFAGLEAVDEVTMLSVPDVMAAYQRGIIDLEAVQAVQLAMIAHCELMGDRVAILDAPPSLNAQQVKEWRIDKAGYDSKYAALYWPWIKVFDPPKGQGIRMPPSGHVGGSGAGNEAPGGGRGGRDQRGGVGRACGRARPQWRRRRRYDALPGRGFSRAGPGGLRS